MGLPLSLTEMIDAYAARSDTPHHTAFSLKYGVRCKASLCGWGPALHDGGYRYEWQDLIPPFYDTPIFFVDIAVCLARPCVLCCPQCADVSLCVRCSGRVCGYHADECALRVLGRYSRPMDLRCHNPHVLLRARALQLLDEAELAS